MDHDVVLKAALQELAGTRSFGDALSRRKQQLHDIIPVRQRAAAAAHREAAVTGSQDDQLFALVADSEAAMAVEHAKQEPEQYVTLADGGSSGMAAGSRMAVLAVANNGNCFYLALAALFFVSEQLDAGMALPSVRLPSEPQLEYYAMLLRHAAVAHACRNWDAPFAVGLRAQFDTAERYQERQLGDGKDCWESDLIAMAHFLGQPICVFEQVTSGELRRPDLLRPLLGADGMYSPGEASSSLPPLCVLSTPQHYDALVLVPESAAALPLAQHTRDSWQLLEQRVQQRCTSGFVPANAPHWRQSLAMPVPAQAARAAGPRAAASQRPAARPVLPPARHGPSALPPSLPTKAQTAVPAVASSSSSAAGAGQPLPASEPTTPVGSPRSSAPGAAVAVNAPPTPPQHTEASAVLPPSPQPTTVEHNAQQQAQAVAQHSAPPLLRSRQAPAATAPPSAQPRPRQQAYLPYVLVPCSAADACYGLVPGSTALPGSVPTPHTPWRFGNLATLAMAPGTPLPAAVPAVPVVPPGPPALPPPPQESMCHVADDAEQTAGGPALLSFGFSIPQPPTVTPPASGPTPHSPWRFGPSPLPATAPPALVALPAAAVAAPAMPPLPPLLAVPPPQQTAEFNEARQEAAATQPGTAGRAVAVAVPAVAPAVQQAARPRAAAATHNYLDLPCTPSQSLKPPLRCQSWHQLHEYATKFARQLAASAPIGLAAAAAGPEPPLDVATFSQRWGIPAHTSDWQLAPADMYAALRDAYSLFAQYPHLLASAAESPAAAAMQRVYKISRGLANRLAALRKGIMARRHSQ